MAEAASEADVIVVGAGPAGSTTAAYLAQHGLSVTLLEKSTFPRDKVCGDGLTPRATRELIKLGIDTSEENGWLHNKGLRVYAGRKEPFYFDWPELKDFPNYGVSRKRADFDKLLADRAVELGAEMVQGANVTAPILDDRTGRIVGVTTKTGESYRAPLVVAADGNSARLPIAMGLNKIDSRPMGVAVRTYYKTPRHDDNYLESWLELWDGEPDKSTLMPGYGWVFPMGDGTSNVGLGVLSTSKGFGKTDYKALMRRWLDNTPEEWGFREENRLGPIQGAALPMSLNRQPLYGRGLLLVGDSGGMVSPFNGEGIAYGMEAAGYAALAIADAHARGVGTKEAERALQGYPAKMRAELGGFYRLGTVFVRLIGNPTIMKLCTRYGLPRKTLMALVMKLLANLTDAHEGDWMDKLVNMLHKAAPSA